MLRKRRPAWGFMVLDVTVGMAIAVSLLIMLGVAVQKQHQASERLSQTRAAVRRLEAVAAGLVAGDAVAPLGPDAAVHVEVLPEPAPMADHVWARLSTAGAAGRGQITLVVLAERRAIEGATEPQAESAAP